MIRIDLALRSQHANYLDHVANRDEISFSEAFRLVIERRSADPAVANHRPVRKVKRHVTVEERHLALLDAMARQWGLRRGEVVRRLIDQARSADERSR